MQVTGLHLSFILHIASFKHGLREETLTNNRCLRLHRVVLRFRVFLHETIEHRILFCGETFRVALGLLMLLRLHSLDQIFDTDLSAERTKLIDLDMFNQIQDVLCVGLKGELRLVINVLSKLWTNGQFCLFSALDAHLYVAAEHVYFFRIDYLLCGVIVETSSRT